MQTNCQLLFLLYLRIKQLVRVFLTCQVISIIAPHNKLGETLGRFKSPLTRRHLCTLYECTYLLLRECTDVMKGKGCARPQAIQRWSWCEKKLVRNPILNGHLALPV